MSTRNGTSSSSSSVKKSRAVSSQKNGDLLLEMEDEPDPSPKKPRQQQSSSSTRKTAHDNHRNILIWINFGGIILLFLLFIIYVFTRPASSSQVVSKDAAITTNRDGYTVKEIPFTVFVEEGSLMMNLSLKLIQMDFVNLIYYDVCCSILKQSIFMCRTSVKTLSMDAYITDKENVILTLSNRDLVGSVCRFTWMERKKVLQ